MRTLLAALLFAGACYRAPQVDLQPVLELDHELEDIAGTDYARGVLYDRLSAAAPHDRKLQAAIAGRRCALASQYEPSKAEGLCRDALRAAQGAQERALVATALRRQGNALRAAGRCAEALATYGRAEAIAPKTAHVERAMLAWGQALCHSARGEHAAARAGINSAREHIADAGNKYADFNAIVDLHSATVAAAAGEHSAACTDLLAAIHRQARLKLENPEYAGYAHYYARILLAEVQTGCAPRTALQEAREIAADLLAHDPRRVEYRQLAEAVQR